MRKYTMYNILTKEQVRKIEVELLHIATQVVPLFKTHNQIQVY